MIFYAPQCTMNTKDYTLSEIESKHCIKVLRKQLGNHIELINGKGGHFSCEIIDPHFKRCKVKIEAKSEYPKSRYDIHIAMAVPKSSERLEWFLEKATELGIQTLSLIYCGNSDRTKINQKRLSLMHQTHSNKVVEIKKNNLSANIIFISSLILPFSFFFTLIVTFLASFCCIS